MGRVMNFGCILAEEERSKIDFKWWDGDAGRKLGPSSSGSECWEPVRLAVPYYFWRNVSLN
jgi:hypothetical protein